IAEEGVTPANHCRSASFCGCHVNPFRTIGNCALGSPSITSPVSRSFWQFVLGESHHGTPLLTNGSLKVSDISWLRALMSQHWFGSPFKKRKALGNRKVEMSRVRMSPAFSAAPIGVDVSVAVAGKR